MASLLKIRSNSSAPFTPSTSQLITDCPAMLNRRPKAADTEDDLMQFQSSFLTSGERPAASLKVLKRKVEDVPRGVTGVGAKDVVRIDVEGSWYV